MHDLDLWDRAVATVAAEYAALPAALRKKVGETAGAIRLAKQGLHRLALERQGGDICAACGGECCRVGKYHVTVVDVLVYFAADIPLFTPRFDDDACPYLGDAGCMMGPPFRPFNCVTFNCERVEDLWEPERVDEFYRREQELRTLYGEMETIFGGRFMHGLLVNFERDVVERGEHMLAYSKRWFDGNDDK